MAQSNKQKKSIGDATKLRANSRLGLIFLRRARHRSSLAHRASLGPRRNVGGKRSVLPQAFLPIRTAEFTKDD